MPIVAPTRSQEIETMMKEMGCSENFISSKGIIDRIEDVDFETVVLSGQQMMFCGIRMKGGFVVTGKPAVCMDPNNWRDEIGHRVSFDNAFFEIYKLEAYRTMCSE